MLSVNRKAINIGAPRLQKARETRRTMRGILGEKQSGRRDDSDCSEEVFAKFFADKVNSIRTST